MPLLRGMLEAAKRRNIDVKTALADLDIEESSLVEADRRLPRSTLFALWAAFASETGDDALGIHLGESTQTGDYAVLDYAMRNSPTLGDAYRQAARYSHVLHDGVDIVVVIDGATARLRYQEPAGSPRQLAEWAVTLWLVVGRQITGTHWRPTQVSFQHSEPEDTTEHRRLFDAPLTFKAPCNELAFDAALLEKPVVAADPALFEVLSAFADQLLKKVPRAESVVDRARQVVAELLRSGDATLDTVAKRLGMARRTLQRKLKAESYSFQALLDEVRCALAKRYLEDRTIAVEETAFLVGFSEPSAFNRAFKRWTGATPSDFRST